MDKWEPTKKVPIIGMVLVIVMVWLASCTNEKVKVEQLLPLEEGKYVMNIEAPIEHQVYQRDLNNKATISFKIQVESDIAGKVEARAITEGESSDWQTIGDINGTTFEGVIVGVSIGQHRLDIRVRSDQTLAAKSVEPILVGDLWVLAGQSNMQGWGKLIDMEEPQVGISLYSREGDQWSQAVEPLGWTEGAMNWEAPRGAGLGIPFAKEVMSHTNVPIGLIMSAVGGSTMLDWDPARLETEPQSLYGDMIRKIRELGGSVKGVLWYQGESEANTEADIYLERMKTFVTQLRKDVGDSKLPFIYAQLSVYHTFDEGGKLWNRIQRDQLELESLIEHAAMVPTIDATLSDPVHLDAASLKRVGQRMAWRAIDMAYGMENAQSGPRPDTYIWNEERTELLITFKGINGKLAPINHAYGFQVTLGSDKVPFTALLTEDRMGVKLQFESPTSENDLLILWHGAGFNPVVNVKDEMGIPLVVFGPVAI
ncbi:hypothetical protein Back11_62970 [Paenibacillus baekrokdamisoli]|uniref:Uncharacterized protein n=2 Tax=Paenibacillus baekrokdamisoli TaxID=1712516 RepID=A0A3G9J307_9BACL|nr:sialate O-acetylesterase [Paenibacillus baekrokdamisoli]MBB3069474.1 sialate O-acetylesterase [Paenibacillus baekrokdamisoli]BBH24952.1 hypothetical protein Back11_62970 [Paenibacillus baekrokdamisoli]